MLEKLILLFCFFLPFQFALNPSPGVDLAIARIMSLLIFSIWLIQKRFHISSKEYGDKISLLLLIFFCIASISVFISPNTIWSLRKLAFLFSFAPLYPVIKELAKKELFRLSIIKSLVLGGIIAGIVGIIQFFSQFIFGINPVYLFFEQKISPFFLGKAFSQTVAAYPSWLVNSGGITYMRAFGTFPDPHMFSYYMGMLLPWAIFLAYKVRENKLMFLIGGIIIFLGDIFSFTRGGYIALFLGGLSILPLVTKESAKKIILSMIILLVLFFIVPSNPVGSRLSSSFDIKEGSNQGRISNWQQAFYIIKSHPLGTGIGAYSLSVDPSASYREPIYAHNLYLDVFAELGIFGIIVFISILILTFKSFWNGALNNKLWLAGLASFVIFCTHSLVETPLYSVQILPLLIILISLGTHAKKDAHIIYN